jgi:hypothetical protein
MYKNNLNNIIIEIKELYYTNKHILIYEKEDLYKINIKNDRLLIKNKNYITIYNINSSNLDKFINSFHENKIYGNYIILINKFFNDYNGNNIPWHDYVKY